MATFASARGLHPRTPAHDWTGKAGAIVRLRTNRDQREGSGAADLPAPAHRPLTRRNDAL